MKSKLKTTLSLLTIVVLIVASAYVIALNNASHDGGNRDLTISDIKKILDAPEGYVDFLYQTGEYADMLGAKSFYDACKHPSKTFYQLGDQLVDEEGCPRPQAFGAGKYLVFFGGPSVQPAVMYYQKSNQTRVSILQVNSTNVTLKAREEGGIQTETFDISEIDTHHDILVIEFFVDNYGRNVLMCYGCSSQGTFAAAVYLVEKVSPDIESYRQSFRILRWVDTNNDYIPEASEIFEKKEKYVSVQAILHWTADPEVVKWFADACHSRGLKVTWYAMPKYNENLTSLLKDYIGLGDDVQMSFGAVFFNTMTTEERVRLVNEQMADFEKGFDLQPSLVEAYYIDAFTLNYIASRFSFIRGAVGYVNHEEFCDGLKTTGAYCMPYYPSSFNALVPGKGESKVPIVMLPFVHRDILNNVLHDDVRFNLSPQDGLLLVDNWREYFENLLNAYLNGWDQFGLAFYPVDLTFEPLPKGVIEGDLDSIRNKIELQNCTNILDKDFTEWFRKRFNDSPCYRWIYDDPNKNAFSSIWYFTPEGREGHIIGLLSQTMRFADNTEEGCYYKPVDPYDNSLTTTLGVKFVGLKTQLIQDPTNQTTYRKRDNASAYDFWNFPICNISADVTGNYEIQWSYRDCLDGKLGSSAEITSSIRLIGGQEKELQLADTRDPITSGRNPNRGGSIAYGDPEGIFDGAWHLFESIIDITVRSPSGTTVTCQGYFDEQYMSTVS